MLPTECCCCCWQGFRFQGLPDLRTCLAIGGVPTSEALDVVKRGVHILVATPGRLMDMLNKKMITLDICRSHIVRW